MQMRRVIFAVALAAAALDGAHGASREPVREQTPLYRSLMQCRSIADAGARVACYDNKLAELDTAEKAGDVVITDRAQLRETSKGLFGFGALKLAIVGSRTKLETPDQIEAEISGLRNLGYGKWEMTLNNNMRWRETEPGSDDPNIGDHVVIRSGALNSFFIRVRGGRAVRGLRVE